MTFFLDALDQCRKYAPTDEQETTTNGLLATIRSRNDSVRALVHVADVPAVDLDAQRNPAAWLAGVPIAVKDLIDVAGMPTCLGSKAVSNVPGQHAAVVAALIQAGAAIVGKCHTTEFAMSGWGVSPLGRPLNPIDAEDVYFTGGSSNGSASAIAAGLIPAALGTDTGGSVRIPSSWCGITGLKGSPGWVSTEGVAALSQSFDVVGPMGRSARDVTQVYRAMLPVARRGAFDATLARAEQEKLPTLIFVDDASLDVIDGEVLAAYRASQTRCEQMGFTVKVTSIPCAFSDMAKVWAGISAVEGYLNNKRLVDDPAAELDDTVRKNFLMGSEISLETYFSLLNQARRIRERVETLLIPGQLLVVPTTSTPAMHITDFDATRTLGIYTRFVNLIQGCAIAVPNGTCSDGRPTSMQFVGAYGQDAAALHAATEWQTHTDWHEIARQRHAEQMQKLSRRM